MKFYSPPKFLVYSFGKVGSKSIEAGIGDGCSNIHNMYFKNWACYPNYRGAEQSLFSRFKLFLFFQYRRLLLTYRKPKIVTAIRDPLDRNMSMFFHHLSAYVFSYSTGFPYGKVRANRVAAEFDSNFLVNVFEERFDHSYPVNWFDLEFKKFTGIDVYKYPFKKASPFQVIKENGFDVFIYRYEDLKTKRNEIEKGISDFCGKSIDLSEERNVAGSKWYSDLYRDFKKNYTPSEKVQAIYDSAYADFFSYPKKK